MRARDHGFRVPGGEPRFRCRRTDRALHSSRDRDPPPAPHPLLIRGRPHVRGDSLAHADGEGERALGAALGRRSPVHLDHDPSDDGRRHGELRVRGRRHPRGAEGADRLCRAPRHQADDQPGAPRGVPAFRVPAPEGNDRSDRPPDGAQEVGRLAPSILRRRGGASPEAAPPRFRAASLPIGTALPPEPPAPGAEGVVAGTRTIDLPEASPNGGTPAAAAPAPAPAAKTPSPAPAAKTPAPAAAPTPAAKTPAKPPARSPGREVRVEE